MEHLTFRARILALLFHSGASKVQCSYLNDFTVLQLQKCRIYTISYFGIQGNAAIAESTTARLRKSLGTLLLQRVAAKAQSQNGTLSIRLLSRTASRRIILEKLPECIFELPLHLGAVNRVFVPDTEDRFFAELLSVVNTADDQFHWL